MNRRIAYVANRQVLQDSGTVTIPLNIQDIVTALTIEFRATNGATSNVNNPLAGCISEIALIDGGEVLWSMNGFEFFGQEAYHDGFIPYELITEIGGNVQNLLGKMQFGRWIGDTQLAFDPSKFKNPQLRFTWNLATITAVGATGYVTGTMVVTVEATIMEGAPSPVGMLLNRKLTSFTTVAAGTAYVNMPTDMPIKSILVRSYIVHVGVLSDISNVKLNCDTNKFVPFDMRDTDFERYQALRGQCFVLKHGFVGPNGTNIYAVLKQDEVLSFARDSGDTTYGYLNTGAGDAVMSVFTAGVADVNPRVVWCVETGWMPFSCLQFDLGEWDDPSSWLDATLFKNIQLELTQSGAGAVASVLVEQLYTY